MIDTDEGWMMWLNVAHIISTVRTCCNPVTDSQQAQVGCPACGQRVSEGRGLEIHQQRYCTERKTQEDEEKHDQERLREQTGKKSE